MDSNEQKTASNFFKLFFGDGEAGAEMLQRINDLVPSIIYIYDAKTKKLSYINKKVTDILGYGFDEINNWDDHLSGLVFSDDAPLVSSAFEKLNALGNNETHTYNTRLNHKHGNWKYFRTTGSVLKRNETGEAESFLFIAEDITHTIETEEEIAAKKELIGEIEDILQFGTWSWDAKTDKLQWSDGLYKLLGYTREMLGDISNEFYMTHVSLNDLDNFKDKIQSSLESKTGFEHIYNITTQAGQEKIVSTKAKVVVSAEGETLKVIGTTRDVTEQINAYRELFHYKQMTLEKEQFLESGSWEIDAKTGKTTWSDGMYRLFGYKLPVDETSPRLDSGFYYSHLQSGIETAKEGWKKLLEEKDNYVTEEIITGNDGKTKRLETFAKVIRNNNGEAVNVMGTTKDITRLKEYERQLEKKLLELERSNKELEEFAYIASHDLQEPLRKISTFSERLKVKFDGVLGEDGKVYLTRMLSAAGNMRMLIDNLLDFSRVTTKAVKYEDADINVLLDEVLTELELQIDESRTTVVKNTMPVLQAIPSQLKQLFSNIILNAIKFRKPGVDPVIQINAGELTAKEAEEYYLQKAVKYCAISISDNGIGFEQEYAEKVFQIFQRLHGKSEYPGAGIGLAICKKIAENHHGKLFAHGQPEKGATFVLVLPEKNN